MMSIQSALIGFLISRTLQTPLTPQEIIVVQTTAVATGTMPLAAGFVGILPALGLLSEERDGTPPIHLSWLAAIGWSCSIAYFGVFMSPPIRKQVIIEEQLPFPSGTATAQLINVLHQLPPPDTTVRRRRGYQELDSEVDNEVGRNGEVDVPSHVEEHVVEERRGTDEREIVEHDGWTSLVWSFGFSAFVSLSAYFFPVLFAIPLFGGYLAKQWLWYFTPSLSYIGQGIIMSFPTTVSMNLGMVVGWAILSPLSKYSGWAPGPVGDMSNGARGWILWTSLGIMCADSLISLLPLVAEYLVDFIKKQPGIRLASSGEARKEDNETETEDRLVPTDWVILGLFASIIIGTVLVWIVFGNEGIKPWATLLGFILGGLLSIIGVRALGETDLNPVSGLGKVSQLFFAWIQPGNIVANIIAGGVAEAGAQQAGDLMQDLKTGHLCHASPRAQFYGQLIGSSISIIVTATAFTLYNRAYTIPGPSFPAPTAYVWLSLARLLRDGHLPEKSAVFMIAFAAVFAVLAMAKVYAVRRQSWIAKWIPSGVAFAIGFLNTPSFSIARLIGGIMEYVYRTRYAKGRRDIRLIVVASGFVLVVGGVDMDSVEAAPQMRDVVNKYTNGYFLRIVDLDFIIRPFRLTLTMSRIELVKIPSLTFYKDSWTQARRTSAIPQLTCVGKPCKLYQPEAVRCVNLGGSGTDVDWKCEADLPEALRFGKVEVSCEGWSKPGDPFVLKGSCGLQYRLVEIPGALRNGQTESPFSFLKRDVIFTVVWVAFLLFFAYNLLKSCFRRSNGSSVRGHGGAGPRPGGGGGGGGGWFPGDHRRDDWSNPPPPYTKNPSNNGANEGWRPGFWTGAALGGLATQFWNNRRQAEPGVYWNQWNQVPIQSGPGSQSMFGSGFSSRRPTHFDDDDRGEGSSNLGSMRRSTGIGGSNVR
ncbi:hypothetical protein AN958_12163 [Leucoagaricus sp. SymC.cos]|nr:hypothetical protein AN958_12163 [Leucoagaricus sp. SymC.cos]